MEVGLATTTANSQRDVADGREKGRGGGRWKDRTYHVFTRKRVWAEGRDVSGKEKIEHTRDL
jgi:hypothetical protein